MLYLGAPDHYSASKNPSPSAPSAMNLPGIGSAGDIDFNSFWFCPDWLFHFSSSRTIKQRVVLNNN